MILLVHGGAGSKKPSRRSLARLTESLASGFDILHRGGTSLDAVIASIKVLEDSGLFNAGAGAKSAIRRRTKTRCIAYGGERAACRRGGRA